MTRIVQHVLAFAVGAAEFRSDLTRHYEDPALLESYDRGRDLMHRLTFRRWDR
jgi:hypothetical protein